MIVKYNKEQLSRIIEDIHILTGISISILDTEYNVITTTQKQEFCSLLHTMEKESRYCTECDKKILSQCLSTKKLERHICKNGLYDCAMPIIKYDSVIAFVIMGQARSADSPDPLSFLPHTDLGKAGKLKQLYAQTPFMTENQLAGLYDLLPHILFNDAIEIVYDPFVNKVIEYIDTNLHRKITIDELCKKFHVSVNCLYEAFRSNINNTVTGYINEQRIRKAKELLEQTKDSVYQIAEKVGVDNYTYFCKLFKKLEGLTPTEYRKKI